MRRWESLDAVVEALRPVCSAHNLALVVVTLGALAPCEQLAQIADASVFVAVHGAELAFTALLAQGAVVIEVEDPTVRGMNGTQTTAGKFSVNPPLEVSQVISFGRNADIAYARNLHYASISAPRCISLDWMTGTGRCKDGTCPTAECQLGHYVAAVLPDLPLLASVLHAFAAVLTSGAVLTSPQPAHYKKVVTFPG